MFFHHFPLPSEVMSHSTISPICQSWFTAIRKWKCFISFEWSIFRIQLSRLQPLKRDWTSLPCCCECQTSAQTHEPPSLPLHHSPGCTVLQDTPSEADSQEVPEHSRETVKPRSSFIGSVLSHALSTCNPASAGWQQTFHHRNQHFWSYLRISDTSIALSSSFLMSPVVAEPPRLSRLAGAGSPYRSPV